MAGEQTTFVACGHPFGAGTNEDCQRFLVGERMSKDSDPAMAARGADSKAYSSPAHQVVDKERERVRQVRDDLSGWRKWGPYLSDRAWGTVREDYSSNGDAWNYVTYDKARAKAYRW